MKQSYGNGQRRIRSKKVSIRWKPWPFSTPMTWGNPRCLVANKSFCKNRCGRYKLSKPGTHVGRPAMGLTMAKTRMPTYSQICELCRQRGRRRRETNTGNADSCSNQDIRSNHRHSGGAHVRPQRQHRAA